MTSPHDIAPASSAPEANPGEPQGASRPGSGFRFVAIEGCNGVGKTTLVQDLSARLGAAVCRYPPEFIRFRETACLDERVSPLPRLLYYIGATLQLADVVRAQRAKSHVVCDRYLASALSLLISQSACNEPQICDVSRLFEPYLCVPDLIVLLTADYSAACRRIRDRERQSGGVSRTQRLVLESGDFYLKRESALRRQTARLAPMVEIDTTGLAADELGHRAWTLVTRLLAGP